MGRKTIQFVTVVGGRRLENEICVARGRRPDVDPSWTFCSLGGFHVGFRQRLGPGEDDCPRPRAYGLWFGDN